MSTLEQVVLDATEAPVGDDVKHTYHICQVPEADAGNWSTAMCGYSRPPAPIVRYQPGDALCAPCEALLEEPILLVWTCPHCGLGVFG